MPKLIGPTRRLRWTQFISDQPCRFHTASADPSRKADGSSRPGAAIRQSDKLPVQAKGTIRSRHS